MAVDFQDDFSTTANSTFESRVPQVGTGYSLTGSVSAMIVNSAGAARVSANVSGTAGYHIKPVFSSANHEVIFQTTTYTTAIQVSFVCVRWQDTSNFMGWRNFSSTATGRRFTKSDAGTLTDLMQTQGVDNEWIRITATGNDYVIYEGGTGAGPGTWSAVTAFSDAHIASEVNVGFIARNGSARNWIQYFEATNLGSAAASSSMTIKVLLQSGLFTNYKSGRF